MAFGSVRGPLPLNTALGRWENFVPAYFAVTRRRGPAWDPTTPMRAQADWAQHAAFMNRLVDEGFILLGGPLAAGETILLVVVAADESEIRSRLDADPWAPLGLLEIATIQPWTILLDGRDRDGRDVTGSGLTSA
jgi:uncharacterized protein YciI